MATEVILPKIGFSMTAGTLAEWLVKDGAPVAAGAPLFSLESDKSVTEVEAPASGVLRVLKPIGESYPVGTVIGMIE
ncbi:MAG TPA: lipoyl domain-containing protein [Steroidobacteraceae bacterium]|nr:lipoyl domain-containing protein [Steroidobacteraceae bacterium]